MRGKAGFLFLLCFSGYLWGSLRVYDEIEEWYIVVEQRVAGGVYRRDRVNRGQD